MTEAGPIKQNSSRSTWRIRMSVMQRVSVMNAQKPRLRNTAPVFAALGDPIRLAMVSRLCTDGPLPTILLKQATSLSRQAVTKHLKLLENIKIVKSQRVGRDRLWRIEAQRLSE